MITVDTKQLRLSATNPTHIGGDYLWTYRFGGIDNKQLYNSLLEYNERIDSLFDDDAEALEHYGSKSSYTHGKYNTFNFLDANLHKLYGYMQAAFKTLLDDDRQYYMRCWFNMFANEKNIDWHNHFPSFAQSYHGFYCVNTEGSNESWTDYKLPNVDDDIRLISHDGLCVIGRSGEDLHKSSPWENDGFRATIAFDIFPLIPTQDMPHTRNYKLTDYIPIV